MLRQEEHKVELVRYKDPHAPPRDKVYCYQAVVYIDGKVYVWKESIAELIGWSPGDLGLGVRDVKNVYYNLKGYGTVRDRFRVEGYIRERLAKNPEEFVEIDKKVFRKSMLKEWR